MTFSVKAELPIVPFAFRVAMISAVLLGTLSGTSNAQLEFEEPPIDYLNAPTDDAVSHLQAKINSGEVTLDSSSSHGYLQAVLKALNVRESSQVLVFSKTSFQIRKITPSRPRAIYFNDDCYVGWVQNGDVVEVSVADPRQGGLFYTLDQQPSDRPQFIRDKGQCTSCHASSRTQGVPGHLIRSVYSDFGGQPILGSGTFTTTHTSPFENRWGGWYVTGTHGDMRHMGNVCSPDRQEPEKLDRDPGANVIDLSKLIDVSPYLQPTSDIVALMVLEHQTQMHNYITLCGFETRSAIAHDKIMNEALDRPADFRSDTTKRRIASVGEKLVRYLLMADEFQLTCPVKGTSTYVDDFVKQGPFDSQGRSLRQFNLKTRVFKYPCSFLIYSEAFDALPAPAMSYVSSRLTEILESDADLPDFPHLSREDRATILEILVETKPGIISRSDG